MLLNRLVDEAKSCPFRAYEGWLVAFQGLRPWLSSDARFGALKHTTPRRRAARGEQARLCGVGRPAHKKGELRPGL